MEWNFIKIYSGSPDGYHTVIDYDEYGRGIKHDEYGPIPVGYEGTSYMDGYLGDDNYQLETRFVKVHKYYTMKKDLLHLGARVALYPEDGYLDQQELEIKNFRTGCYNSEIAVLNAINALEEV